MTKPPQSKDFRASRELLPDEVFALSDGPRPGPTDLISEDVWNGIMHLPDDVALTTSNHHGLQLASLYELWGDWLIAMGNEHDALFGAMLDAADCFQSSTFDCLHGYYRSAIANLRSAMELVAIGALGNLAPADEAFARWNSNSAGSGLTFPSTYKRLQGAATGQAKTFLVKQRGWMETFYYKLCGYAHSRPDSSDGAMWSTNGPIYVGAVMNDVYRLQTSTYAIGYILAMIGRPKLTVPPRSGFLFSTPALLWSDDIAAVFELLCGESSPPSGAL